MAEDFLTRSDYLTATISASDADGQSLLASRLWTVLSPPVVVIGLFGNTLALVVCLGTPLRHSVPARYLVAMAVADTGALLFGLVPTWILHTFNVDIAVSGGNWTCRLRDMLRYSSQDAAIWYVCSFTFDRLVAVLWPLERNKSRHDVISSATIVSVATVALLKNVHIVWTRSAVSSSSNYSVTVVNASVDSAFRCSFNRQSQYFETVVRPWIVLTFVNVLPFVFLVVCNVAIVRRMINARQERHRYLAAAWRGQDRQSDFHSHVHTMTDRCISRGSGAAAGVTATRAKTSHRCSPTGGQVGRLTTTCLAVSITFLLLVSPSIVLLAVSSCRSLQIVAIDQSFAPVRTSTMAAVYAVTGLLNYTNSAVNFYLYCLTGSQFRRQVVFFLTCRLCQRRRYAATSNWGQNRLDDVISRSQLRVVAERVEMTLGMVGTDRRRRQTRDQRPCVGSNLYLSSSV